MHAHIPFQEKETVSDNFETLLGRYADLIVQIGLNLQPGQRLVVQAPIQAAPLVRQVAASAYRSQARLVDVLWGDELVTLARFQHAPRDSFEEFPTWKPKALEEYLRRGDALLSVYAENPDLLKEQDPKLVGTAMTTAMKHSMPVSDLVSRNASNWNVVSMPIPSWSTKVYPDLAVEEAEQKLWQAIFETCRLYQDDPVAAWKEHVRQLGGRCQYLNDKRYAALKFTAPGTDLTVGLADGHQWFGGSIDSANGISFVPNLPTEEVFTAPHKDRINGVVCSSKPLNYGGTLIKDFSLTFKDGQVVDFQAAEGQEVLRDLLGTDEGSRRLGEVALVPHSAPTSSLNLMFFNTLYDENAASHLALGRAYRFTLQNGAEMSQDELLAAGANHSMAHVDFMVGSGQTDVDGILPGGAVEALMRQGEWVFEV
jgi:aminopeptidase